MSSQSLVLNNSATKLHDLIIEKGNILEKYERLKVGCKPKICELYDLVVLNRIVCKDLCYINDSQMESVESYLAIRNKK